jgi:RNA polymerase sigma factor (sigma-70 family)
MLQVITPSPAYSHHRNGKAPCPSQQPESKAGLIALSNEELCQNAQRGCARSKALLWQRCQEFVRGVAYNKNFHHGLPSREMADAVQELYFAFHEALQQYDPQHHSNHKPASFKTFLGTVVAHAFSEYCRRRRKYYRRTSFELEALPVCCFIVEPEESRREALYPVDRNGCCDEAWDMILLNEISSDRLATALRELKPKARAFLELWLHCGRDKEVAYVLGISPAAAKLRRERLFRRIRKAILFSESGSIT